MTRLDPCHKLLSCCDDYLDGVLSEREAECMRQHLASCAQCQLFVRSYQTTTHLCQQAMAPTLPHAVEQRLTTFLRRMAHVENRKGSE